MKRFIGIIIFLFLSAAAAGQESVRFVVFRCLDLSLNRDLNSAAETLTNGLLISLAEADTTRKMEVIPYPLFLESEKNSSIIEQIPMNLRDAWGIVPELLLEGSGRITVLIHVLQLRSMLRSQTFRLEYRPGIEFIQELKKTAIKITQDVRPLLLRENSSPYKASLLESLAAEDWMRKQKDSFRFSLFLCPLLSLSTSRLVTSWSMQGPCVGTEISAGAEFLLTQSLGLKWSVGWLFWDWMDPKAGRWEATSELLISFRTTGMDYYYLDCGFGVTYGYNPQTAVFLTITGREYQHLLTERFGISLPLHLGYVRSLSPQWYIRTDLRYSGLSAVMEDRQQDYSSEGFRLFGYDKGFSAAGLLSAGFTVSIGYRF